MPSQKITRDTLKEAISKAQKTGKGQYLWDTTLRGFGMYASPNGRVSWLAQKWKGGAKGRPVREVVAEYPHLSMADARELVSSRINEISSATDIVSHRDKVRKARIEALEAARLEE